MWKSSTAFTGFWAGVFLLLRAATVQAEPITFDFTFEEQGGTATAVGFITVERTLFPNPKPCLGMNDLSDAAVLALQVTVSGAASGNGTFTLGDFGAVAWCTKGATLDLTAELVGQPTPGDTFGTPNGNGGDFNLFGSSPGAPVGMFFFTLCAGHENCMVLTSMIAGPLRGVVAAAAPALSPSGVVVLSVILMAIGSIALRRRSTR